ncbi:MAG: hypothetical protein VX733_09335 [Candidatus Latescibacterota bacterium]|nr:hypothetical protein [Candidatus Latescibacterota bacterium]
MPLEPWIRIGQPLENVIEDYERIFDAWEEGGIRGMVFGRLLFADEAGGFTTPAFATNPEPYRQRGIELGEASVEPDATRERQLHDMLVNAKARGWRLLIFCPGQGTSRAKALPAEEDPYGARLQAAVWEDVFSAFPEAEGGIMDGWTESAYELVYHHGNAVFRDIDQGQRDKANARGWDAERLERGRTHLHRSFQSLTPKRVGHYGDHGLLSMLNLFDVNEDALYWLCWRREDGLREGQAFRAELDALPRRLLLGNGLRSAVFSGMTAMDFVEWDEVLDFLLVKHYFWHRGFDGMYGTVARWVQQVGAWNPTLSEADCFTVVRAWLGIDLPEISTLADMELGFPQTFFDETVALETRRAIEAASDPGKILPWVDTGRMPHAGDPMTAGDLHRILIASAGAGLQRFLFHNHGHLTAAEWKVISRMCGTEWNEDPNGYWPPATPKSSTFG